MTRDYPRPHIKEWQAQKEQGKQIVTEGSAVPTEPEKPPGSTSNRNDGTRNSTGFAIAASDNGGILTCAHTMDECYALHVDQELTVAEANLFFFFSLR